MSEEERFERKLTAILAADVAGYSRLMGVDEEGTLRQLKAHRKALVDPKIAEHRGRIVKTTGDGMLVEFNSVVDAVRCAVDVQRGMAERNIGVPPERRIAFRVGVNLGDIIIDGEDIFGDGVNVAARLEALAEPGGICISRTVRDHVLDKLGFAFDDMGEQSVKNIARPVNVHRVLFDGAPVPAHAGQKPSLAIGGTPAARWRNRPRWALPAAALCAALLVIALGWGWLGPRLGLTAGPAPNRFAIAVLPFENLSGNSDHEPFVDAITEDLITDLSRISGAFVIARNTMMTYKGHGTDVKQIGRELGVGYVLEGSVRRGDKEIRVNAQLIDTASGAHVWAERFDLAAIDAFSLQSEITGRIARALNLQLISAEGQRAQRERPASLGAVDLAAQAWSALFSKPATEENNAEAMTLADRAIALDETLVLAWTARAYAFYRDGFNLWSDRTQADSYRLARHAAEQAITLDGRSADPHYVLGITYGGIGEFRRCVELMEETIALNANFAPAYMQLGTYLARIGREGEALAQQQRAFVLSPRDPQMGNWLQQQATVFLILKRYEEALDAADRAIRHTPAIVPTYFYRAAALELLGRIDEAKSAMRDALLRNPRAHIADLSISLGDDPAFVPHRDRIVAALRRAGMPD